MTGGSLIGPIPGHWNVSTLGEVTKRSGGDIQTGPFGSQLHASDYVDDGIPSIMPKNIGDNRVEIEGIARITQEDARRLERYRVRPGDIVYSRRGDVEKRALIREAEDGWLCGTGCLRVRFGNDSVSPEYASYYLGHPAVRAWIVRHAHGATMPNLNTSLLGALPFVVPPLEEQRTIAHILGTLDDKIELNRQMNQTLDEIARVLFTSWFVKFDPVRAKEAGRKPEWMDAETAALFPDRIVESNLGPIPEGWTARPFTTVAKVIGGGTPKTSVAEHWNGDIPWFAMADLPNNGSPFVISTGKQITESGESGSSAKRVSKNATILTARGTVGEAVIAGLDMAFNQSCYALEPEIEGLGPFTLFLLTRSQVDVLRSRAHGSVFATITRATLDSLTVPIPTTAILTAVEASVAPLFALMLSNSLESATLGAMRDTLLPRLLAGQFTTSPWTRRAR